MIDYTIVYKTYQKDLDWLRYSLISLKKYINRLPPMIIYYHIDCINDLNKILSELEINPKLIPVYYDIHGYLKQMVIKSMCFQDVQTEYIMIMDSDVILKNKFNIQDFFDSDGKINWSIKKRTSINNSESIWSVWEKSIVNMMIGEKMTTFYMFNGFPFLLKRKTLSDANEKFQDMHKTDYNGYCKYFLNKYKISPNDPLIGVNGKFLTLATIFTEFEYIGWFAYNHTDDYNFSYTVNPMSYNSSQYWSHGGLKPEIEKEIQYFIYEKKD